MKNMKKFWYFEYRSNPDKYDVITRDKRKVEIIDDGFLPMFVIVDGKERLIYEGLRGKHPETKDSSYDLFLVRKN